MIELLPCPFCGGEAEIIRFGNRRQSTQYSCNQCGCHLETNEERDHGTRWNERPPIKGDDADFEWARGNYRAAYAIRHSQQMSPERGGKRSDS